MSQKGEAGFALESSDVLCGVSECVCTWLLWVCMRVYLGTYHKSIYFLLSRTRGQGQLCGFVSVTQELDGLEERHPGSSGTQRLADLLPARAALFPKNRLLQLCAFICSPGKEGNVFSFSFLLLFKEFKCAAREVHANMPWINGALRYRRGQISEENGEI